MKLKDYKGIPVSHLMRFLLIAGIVSIFLIFCIVFAFVTIFSRQAVEQQYNVLELVSTTESTAANTGTMQFSVETTVTTTVNSDAEVEIKNTTEIATSEIADTSETSTEAESVVFATDTMQEDSIVEEMLDAMTLEDKIYQLFIVTPEALVNNGVSCVTESGDMTKNALQEKPVGGIIYFAQNLVDGEQTKCMISNAQMYAEERNGIGLWIAVDEEGGMVARVASKLGTTNYSSMEYYGSIGNTDEVYSVGQGIAADISSFGFNLDFAPVADINLNPNNELGDRIFSSDANVVSDMVGAMVSGLQSNGQVSATLKHFPGLGASEGNTHSDSQTIIYRTYEELMQNEFVAFRGGIDAGADFVMVGHQTMSAADDNMPSDLSGVVVNNWLRGDLGFQGVVVTDAHQMNTISSNYTSGDAAVMAIQAGVDIVLMPADLNDAFYGVYNAVQSGQISENRIDESVRRILTKKEAHGLLQGGE